ncbi:MAG: Trk system potassium transporter TrkA [Synergistaceae bacterium]|jgi:trk system potassium uptake protein TrkA|nr:Trk system potassium transporter TrkA [Synergistaceae bacterium]
MNVIVIGDGNLGYSLAKSLSTDGGNDVTIIEKNAGMKNNTIESLDVRYIKGNGASARTLIEAGVRDTDLLIAATSGDEMNMVCSLTAKRLGASHTIARIRDPEYADELSQIKEDLGLDLVINPEQAVGGEIAKLLELPPAISVELFAGGRVEMAEIKAAAGMPIVDMPLKEIPQKIGSSILIGAILRGGEVIIPRGEDVILADDTIYIVGHPSMVFRFCAQIGIRVRKIKNVMLAGGGRIGYYLAKALNEIDMSVKIIESRYERCVELAEILPQTLVINGDASDSALLRAENIGDMGGFVSVTDKDEENLMTALLAKRNGVPKVVAKMDRAEYADILGDIGIDNLVSTKAVTANYILRFARGLQNAMGNFANTLYKIVGDRAEAIEFSANKSARLLGRPLKDLSLVSGVLVLAIVRKNEIIIPHGNDSIEENDSVILITKGRKLLDLNDILTGEETR